LSLVTKKKRRKDEKRNEGIRKRTECPNFVPFNFLGPASAVYTVSGKKEPIVF